MASVVIVDDAELFREALRAAFVQEGFEVKAVAADAMHAIDMAREHQPDLVMLDLLMPGMSGRRGGRSDSQVESHHPGGAAHIE